MIEREIFKRRIVHSDLLEKFGFIRSKEGFIYHKELLPNMLVEVFVSPLGEVVGKVFDEDFHEEYVNHRQEDAEGAFVIGVKNAFEALLRAIAENCTTERRYLTEQAERIDGLISERFGVLPEFLFRKFPHFGVYRRSDSRKWFAMIMNLDKGKVLPGSSGETDVMNLKLDEEAGRYLGLGVYPSYHMNKKNWVTVLLDGALSDDLIMEMIEISYRNTKKKSRQALFRYINLVSLI